MPTGNPWPVEEWAPRFLAYWSEEQILKPEFAISFGHCKLCDDKVTGSVKDHMRTHKNDLKAFTSKRRKEAQKKSLAGLALARAEKAKLKTIEPTEEDE